MCLTWMIFDVCYTCKRATADNILTWFSRHCSWDNGFSCHITEDKWLVINNLLSNWHFLQLQWGLKVEKRHKKHQCWINGRFWWQFINAHTGLDGPEHNAVTILMCLLNRSTPHFYIPLLLSFSVLSQVHPESPPEVERTVACIASSKHPHRYF